MVVCVCVRVYVVVCMSVCLCVSMKRIIFSILMLKDHTLLLVCQYYYGSVLHYISFNAHENGMCITAVKGHFHALSFF